MTEFIEDHYAQKVKSLAKESMTYVEPICQECWDEGKDEPLGESGVQTPYNKKINQFSEDIVDENDEYDHAYTSDIRFELVEIFYDERQRLFKDFNRKVDKQISCEYCYQDKGSYRNDTDLQIRIGDDTINKNHLFGRDEKDWR